MADFDRNGRLDVNDIHLLFAETDNLETNVALFDLTYDQLVDETDLDELVVSVMKTRYGDADLDGDVDRNDFFNLSKSFGIGSRDWSKGNLDGNGRIEFSDFIQLANNFGFGNDA